MVDAKNTYKSGTGCIESQRANRYNAYRRRGSLKNAKEANTMSIREIESKARELRQWLAIIEEAQAEVEALKDEIKAAMGEAEAVQAGEYKISWKNVTSSRLDTAALKKALPEIAARFTRESTTRRFTIA